MNDDEIQGALDEALKTGEATYKLSHGRNAIVLSVKNENRLIPLMDELFNFTSLDFNSGSQRHPGNAVPLLLIDSYIVTPKFERRIDAKCHVYELTYSKKSESSY